MKWAWLVVVYLHVVTVTSQEITQDNSALWVEVDDAATERQQERGLERQCACQVRSLQSLLKKLQSYFDNMTQAVDNNVQIVADSIQQAVQQMSKCDNVSQALDKKVQLVAEFIQQAVQQITKHSSDTSQLEQTVGTHDAKINIVQQHVKNVSASVVASTDTMLVKLQDVEKQNTRLLASMQQQMSSQAAQLAKLQADLSVVIGAIPQSMKCKVHDKLGKINGKNYYFSDVQVPWSEALQFCDKNGMQLVSFETEEEWLAMESHLNKTYGRTRDWAYWTSGSDARVEGTWVWASTGQPMTFHVYSNMFNNDNANCMAICSVDKTCKWTDDKCSKNYRFICEMSSQLCVN